MVAHRPFLIYSPGHRTTFRDAIGMKHSNLIDGLTGEVTQWRRHLHENPELGYEEHETAAFVSAKLREFGFDEVHEGIGQTGVVGVLHGKNGSGGRRIGLRADMDALPIEEAGDPEYKSRKAGVMHACGHDGHTALLLGAAKGLAETRAFDGTVHFIFQPAEEGGAGAKAMMDDGLFERFDVEEVYGLHNMPGVDIGEFQIRTGPLLAAGDRFTITVQSPGGHGAMPHQTVDPVVIGAQIILALQTVVSRETDAVNSAVLTIAQLQGSEAENIIPSEVIMKGTLRTLDADDRTRIEQRIRDVSSGVAKAMGARAQVEFRYGYPATVNHPEQTRFAASVAAEIVGSDKVDDACPPIMPAEDFAFMLEEKPGAYIFLGNGDSAACHMPDYDFDDTAIPYGVGFWIRLVEKALPV